MARRLTLTAAGGATGVLTASTGTDRTITGMALPYGVTGRTSAGDVTVRPGAIRVPTELRRVKLFTEHGRRRPVGYALTASSGAGGLTMSFHAAATPDGDAALTDAAEGTRDALSVELDNVELTAGEVTGADLVAVALVAVPAFASARLVASNESTDDDDDDDDDDDKPAAELDADTDDDPPAAPGGSTTTQPTPGGSTVPPLNATRRTGRKMTAARMLPKLEAVYLQAHDASQLNAALADVVPANDAGEGWLRFQWLGELWTPSAVFTDYTSSIQSATLTGPTVKGWRWATKPVVGPYAGNKTAIPTNTVSTEPAEADAVRLAGGWDVDRIYTDLGSAGFIESLFSAAIADLGAKQAAYVGAGLLAAAAASTATPGTAIEAITVAATELNARGATASFIAVSSDLWAEYLGVTSADAPWWLAAGSAVSSLRTSAGNVADLRIFADPGLPAGTVLAGDRRAATYYTAKPDPVRVTAVNVPNGGIDIAVFSYQALMVNNPAGLVEVTVAPVIP
jgi:hypothetical protein